MSGEAFKGRRASCVTVIILALNNFVLLLKSVNSNVLEYKVLNFKFACVAMCSLLMSPFSRDLQITQLVVFTVFKQGQLLLTVV